MLLKENYFIPFNESIDSYELPQRFTFPFYYQPHPLCLIAAKELQNYLKTQTEWHHNFGLSDDKNFVIGKMFGVLLVQNKQNEIGYLAAFSGKLAGKNHFSKFVPPVFDLLEDDGFFKIGQLEINEINGQIEILEKNPQIFEYEMIVKSEKESSILKIEEQRKLIIEGRKNRKYLRSSAEKNMNSNDFLQLKERLSKESVNEKNQLKKLKKYWANRIDIAEKNYNRFIDEITVLKNKRKDLSAILQKKIFSQYCFLNSKGISKSLGDIFIETSQQTPPAGAGECATPKLLQYAFKSEMKPLAMAEFWWGASPKSEVRKHLNFYPACHGKCKPILGHMLEGIEIDDNPLINNSFDNKTIDIIYEDDVMLVINKPAEFLSVPGKDIEDSVYLRIKQLYPKATGSLIVHRLDMSTSGLMLIALTKESHKNLQKQFIKRSIKKRYIALLNGLITEEEGVIELPLRVDLDDRPRQLVCYEYGKSAKTLWRVIERRNNQTKVYFYPETGRTHQLRVHSAHYKGLNSPIVGDDLYGVNANRLHLHAEFIEFKHPASGELMSFQIEAEF
ncbi:MAG: RluA family pseudouridine synthase [Gammaproteobacteria bacterium]|nr:RluA family pseudouridine synthase [Gammaproteobacteria bacterium]